MRIVGDDEEVTVAWKLQMDTKWCLILGDFSLGVIVASLFCCHCLDSRCQG